MRRTLKDMTVLGLGALAVLYLVNPTAGLFEFIPDMLPVVGNLDEATAAVILAGAFRYFGVDLTRLFKQDEDAPHVIRQQRRER